MNGQQILSQSADNESVDLKTLKSGMFIIQLQLKSGNVVSQKLMLK